jgi:hypothetical protein
VNQNFCSYPIGLQLSKLSPYGRNKNSILVAVEIVMRKVCFLFVILAAAVISSCGSSRGTTEVTKPRYHHTWAKNRYRIDIPIGARHIRLFERKRTRTVSMK